MPTYKCPILLDAPRVPVITSAGMTYDFISLATNLLGYSSPRDPLTRGVITTLIYNRALQQTNAEIIDELLPLSPEEKNQVASCYVRLTLEHPTLKIYGIDALEGMKALIDAHHLREATRRGLVIVVRQLLASNEVDPNNAMVDGATPLLVAAENGHLDTVNALLADPRVNPNQAMTYGGTPLLMAADNDHLDILSALLADPRVNPNQAAANGETPIIVAVQHGHRDSVNALLADPRVNPNQAMTDGTTPLSIAEQRGHLRIVEILQADPRVQSELTETQSTNGFRP